MFVTSRRSGWTQQETLCYSHLEQTRPTRRVLTLEWSRQAFEVLLIGSGDGSSRIYDVVKCQYDSEAGLGAPFNGTLLETITLCLWFGEGCGID